MCCSAKSVSRCQQEHHDTMTPEAMCATNIISTVLVASYPYQFMLTLILFLDVITIDIRMYSVCVRVRARVSGRTSASNT